MTRRWLRLGAIAGLLIALACESVAPRLPFPVVEPWLETSAGRSAPDDGPDDGDEQTLWDEAARAIEALDREGVLLEDEPLRAHLQSLTDQIAPPIRAGGPKFRVHLVDDSVRNAAALPDGNLLLTLGIVAAFENEAELSLTLGHEIAHVVLRHALVRSRYDARTSSYVDRMRLRRELERRADAFGLRLTVAAGFSAEASFPALERIEGEFPTSTEQVKSWESHPDLRTRRRNLIHAAKSLETKGARGDSEAFTRLSRSIRLRTAERALADGRTTDARALVDRELAEAPTNGRAHFLRGETTRRLHPDRYTDEAVLKDFERAVELSPQDPDALRALGLLLWETDQRERAAPLLRRYLDARPDALDRKIIERYLSSIAD